MSDRAEELKAGHPPAGQLHDKDQARQNHNDVRFM